MSILGWPSFRSRHGSGLLQLHVAGNLYRAGRIPRGQFSPAQNKPGRAGQPAAPSTHSASLLLSAPSSLAVSDTGWSPAVCPVLAATGESVHPHAGSVHADGTSTWPRGQISGRRLQGSGAALSWPRGRAPMRAGSVSGGREGADYGRLPCTSDCPPGTDMFKLSLF